MRKLPGGIIFDMDGVIFDTERLYIDVWKPIAAEFHIPDIEETLYRCIGVTSKMAGEIFLDRYGENFPLETYQRMASNAFHEAAERDGMPMKKGIRELLEFLKENEIPTAVASSTRTETVRAELTMAGLAGFFQEIIGGDMVARSKPEPDIFLKAAECLGIRSAECMVIEDSYNGIRAAKAGGMTAIMIPDLLKPDAEMKALADHIFDSLPDVKEFLGTLR